MSQATNQANSNVKRGRGRPPKNQKSNAPQEVRPTRVPVHQQRDKITVGGKNPLFEYRWVKDGDEAGQHIAKFNIGGWNFTQAKDVQVGQSWVHESSYGGGSLVRRPADESIGTYYYLMQLPKDLYDEDQHEKQADIYAREQEMLHGETADAAGEAAPDYGNTKIKNPHRRPV